MVSVKIEAYQQYDETTEWDEETVDWRKQPGKK